MNYRHAFHAGNFADVFKHTILLELIDALVAKPGAFCYVDTHAGRGCYDLRSEAAVKTGEAADGVQRLLRAEALPEALQRYTHEVRAFGAGDGGELVQYPGSPLLVQARLREQDRAIVCELQAEEAVALKAALRGDARLAIHQRDGYAALKALLPPPQKRGLVLIDPPFEAQAGEFDAITAALADGFAKWPNAIYAVWYPIKLRETILPFYRWLHAHAGKADVLAVELLLQPPNTPLRLSGCGMVLVNPPWQFDRRLQTWMQTAQDLLAPADQGSHRIEWLKTG
jgi:23S rRNA (adenine2030-N6)-methyltransferase